MTLKRVAIVIFFSFIIYNIVVVTSQEWPNLGQVRGVAGCIGAMISRNVGDIRLWALGIGIVLLKKRDGGGWWGKKRTYDSPRDAR